MNDTELDRRLEDLRTATSPAHLEDSLVRLAAHAALDAEATADPERRPRRTRWTLGLGLAAAAILLTAGTAATSIYLEIPPFQDLEKGAIRTTESIPMRYETTNGIEIRCRIFLDFKNVSPAQVATVDDAIRSHDWSTFGQDLYDAQPDLPPAPPLSESLSPQDPVEAAELPAISAFVTSVIPGIRFDPYHPTAPMVSSIGETCVPSAQ